MTNPTIGKNIRKYRNRRGWGQEGLARRAKVAHMTVSRLERDIQQPSVAILGRIARALGVTLNDLAGDA